MRNIRDIKMRVGNILILYKGNEGNALYDLYSKMNEDDLRGEFTTSETEALMFNLWCYPDNPKYKAQLAEREAKRVAIKENNVRLINEALKLLGSNIVFKKGDK